MSAVASRLPEQLLAVTDKSSIIRLGAVVNLLSLVSTVTGLVQTTTTGYLTHRGFNANLSTGTVCGLVTLIIGSLSIKGAISNSHKWIKVIVVLGNVGVLTNLLLTASSMQSLLAGKLRESCRGIGNCESQLSLEQVAMDAVLLIISLVQCSLWVGIIVTTGQYICCGVQKSVLLTTENQKGYSKLRKLKMKKLGLAEAASSSLMIICGVISSISSQDVFSVNSEEVVGVWVGMLLLVFASFALAVTKRNSYRMVLACTAMNVLGAILSVVLIATSASSFATNTVCPTIQSGSWSICLSKLMLAILDSTLLALAVISFGLSVKCVLVSTEELSSQSIRQTLTDVESDRCNVTVTPGSETAGTLAIYTINSVGCTSPACVLPSAPPEYSEPPPAYEELHF